MTNNRFLSHFFAGFLLLTSPLLCAETLVGKVVKVADGDTITVLDSQHTQHRIRLVGIDAPEKKQPYGQASKKSLSDLVFGKQVVVDFNKLDRYKRVIGKVSQNGEDVNLAQVKRGMAWHYKKYQNEQELDERSLYAQEEYLAQRDHKGLWSDKEPVAPWDFRKSKK
jgi:endonuclease YncB( thermonuclease family)